MVETAGLCALAHDQEPVPVPRRPKSAAASKPDVPVHLKLWWSVPEAMAMTGLGESTLYRWVREGVVLRVPHTDRVLIPRVEFERLTERTPT